MADPMSQDEPSTPMPPAGDEAAPMDPGSDGGDMTTVLTICKGPDGGYMVYAGDKPDTAAGEGEAPGDAGSGMPADSVGAALKAALDILKADEGGDEQGDFNAGFDGGSAASPAKAPPPAPMA